MRSRKMQDKIAQRKSAELHEQYYRVASRSALAQIQHRLTTKLRRHVLFEAYRAASPAMFAVAFAFAEMLVPAEEASGLGTGTGTGCADGGAAAVLLLTTATSDNRRRALAASIRLNRPLSLPLPPVVVALAPAPRRPAGSVMAQDVLDGMCSFDNN